MNKNDISKSVSARLEACVLSCEKDFGTLITLECLGHCFCNKAEDHFTREEIAGLLSKMLEEVNRRPSCNLGRSWSDPIVP